MVQDQLRTARAQAISDRGEYIVTFTTTGTITTTAARRHRIQSNHRSAAEPMFSFILYFRSLPKTPDNFVPSGQAVDLDQSGVLEIP